MYKNMNPTFSSTSAYNKSERLQRFWFYRFTGSAGLDTDNYLTIHRVAVSNKYRGKGIATLLFEYAYQYAKNKGLDSIRVDTHIGNIPMQSLTKKLDFKPCGYVIYDYIEVEPKRLIFEKLVH